MADDEETRKAAALQAYRQKLVKHNEIDSKACISPHNCNFISETQCPSTSILHLFWRRGGSVQTRASS